MISDDGIIKELVSYETLLLCTQQQFIKTNMERDVCVVKNFFWMKPNNINFREP